jgi:hypothetical protein
MKIRERSDEAIPKARRNGSREAIVAAAERLFLERKFGAQHGRPSEVALASLGFFNFVLAFQSQQVDLPLHLQHRSIFPG